MEITEPKLPIKAPTENLFSEPTLDQILFSSSEIMYVLKSEVTDTEEEEKF